MMGKQSMMRVTGPEGSERTDRASTAKPASQPRLPLRRSIKARSIEGLAGRAILARDLAKEYSPEFQPASTTPTPPAAKAGTLVSHPVYSPPAAVSSGMVNVTGSKRRWFIVQLSGSRSVETRPAPRLPQQNSPPPGKRNGCDTLAAEVPETDSPAEVETARPDSISLAATVLVPSMQLQNEPIESSTGPGRVVSPRRKPNHPGFPDHPNMI